MPLREYLCRECGHIWEELVRNPSDEPNECCQCESKKIETLPSAHGGYSGNFGGGSTKPRNAGSFAGRRKV
jgi:putative FmdB family regulatory protein